MQILPITDCNLLEYQELIESCGPFIKFRDGGVFWLYQTLFSGTSFVARVDTGLVGVVVGCHDQNKRDELYIEELGVHSQYRGRGIAKKLFAAVENEAVYRGVKRLWFTTNPMNPACDIWPKYGYRNNFGDEEVNGFKVIKNLKGQGQDRAIFEKFI
jgi:ribosomal protein S18 acetylase RimI-like enzyme